MGATARRVLRSIGAVLAGMAAVVVPSIATDAALHAAGVYPPLGKPMGDGLFVLATAYRTVYAVLGSYAAARLAADRPMRHAMAVGVVGLVVCIAGAVATRNAGPEFGPGWYPLALISTTLPCAWAGGMLGVMRRHPRTGTRVSA